MSHASLIVAIEPQHKLWSLTNNQEAAITWEMEPFDENHTAMFGDGSRWDYWLIGGRWEKFLNGKNLIDVKDWKKNQKTSFAFLHKRQWHECRRLGWFGCTAPTECERAGSPEDKDWKCLFKHKSGARIISWNSNDEAWSEKFYQRFIKPLPKKTQLIVVDYHV